MTGEERGTNKPDSFAERAKHIELLKSDDPSARRILQQAVLIHATDTAAAAYAGARGELQGKAAKFTIAISALNTVLAVVSFVTAKRCG